jgi:tetratricopeptide (TPR) repeat protein
VAGRFRGLVNRPEEDFMRPELALLATVLFAACSSMPTSNRYGTFHRQITTKSAEAQHAFDEGMLLCYGFNHDEAVHRFEAALKADPDCAMAWWGIGYALGPNFNMPLTDAAVNKRAFDATHRAMELATRPATPANSTATERALIDALAQRYSEAMPADRAPQDRAYAEAMGRAAATQQGDVDVAVLYAEALLDLSPWNQWQKDGKPRDNTLTILATLEQVLAKHPDHPGALHFYIHTTEGSPTPEKALAHVARLPALAPGCGHLVHMPAHTLMRCGRYQEALAANLAAVDVDHAFFAANGPQGVYHGYLAHNQHFAVYAAMFLGDSKTALQQARALVAELPPPLKDGMPEIVDGFMAVPLHVLIRFGRWQEILSEPAPGEKFAVSTAMWHYARGVAFANTEHIAEAKQEQAEFARLAAAVKPEATVGLTPGLDVLKVAAGMLAGEIGFRGGDRAAGLQSLRAAVAAEDALRYDEPPGWMQPVRHTLGALLLESGDVAAATAVYREDLQQHHDNGWSLYGLAECQRRSNDPAAVTTDAAFQKAWVVADVKLHGSCFCAK